MKKIILPFAILANFLIVGCGGGSNYSTIDDGLPTPTAKIEKNQTKNIIETIQKTQLEPISFLSDSSRNERHIELEKLEKMMKLSYVDENNTEACSDGGTKEIKVISGQSDEDSNATSGTYKYQTVYNNCKEYSDIAISGTIDATEKWTKDQNNSITYTGEYKSKNLVYQKDDKHKFMITDSLRMNSGKYNNSSPNQEGTSDYTYSGKLINGDETLEFKNINHEFKFRVIFKEHIMDIKELYDYHTIFGAIKSSKLKGWITIHTPTPYEKTEKDKVETSDGSGYCYHKGKLVIKGADHTITQEVASDHSITEKFDNTIIKKYKNCIEYYKSNSN